MQQRGADLPGLFAHWVELAVSRWGVAPRVLPEAWARSLAEQPWEGNLTQLQQHLFQWLLSGDAGHLTQLLPAAEAASPLAALAPQATLAEVERFWIQQTLERHHGNRTQAAESLGINPSTLFRKLKNGAA